MDEDEAVSELKATVKKLVEGDKRRAAQVEYRDRQIRDIMAAKKTTWTRMQEITGLSPRGLQLALERANRQPDH